MARTRDQIKQVMLDAKAADATLAGLTSPSKTAFWRLIIEIVAYAIWVLESLWDTKKAELQELTALSRVGTDKWYADQMFNFQYGYSLVESNGKLIYLVEDEEAKIIKNVAARTQEGILVIKLAKESAGELVKLTAAEKTAAESYINDIKFGGTTHLLVSEDPDLVKVKLQIFYDGKLDLAAFQATVEAAINGYLRGIYFNGVFNINDFRDALEATEGVEDTLIQSIQIKPSTGAFLSVIREYNPVAGYFKIDPAYPLNNAAQIEYIAQ